MYQNQNIGSWEPIQNILEQKNQVATDPALPVSPVSPAAENPFQAAPHSTISDHDFALFEKLISQLSETVASLKEFAESIKTKYAQAGIRFALPASHPPRGAHENADFMAPARAHTGAHESSSDEGLKIIEGVFDGSRMVGADGALYPVPPNYASKSKLVEGDLMKLTVTHRGAFIYKQIGPMKRARIVGELIKRTDGDNLYDVLAQGKVFHVLTAAVTYYKGESGDEAVILVPDGSPSQWAALDNIIKHRTSSAPYAPYPSSF